MANNEWHTPLDLVDDLKNAVGGFDLDPCSGAEPEPIAPIQYTKDDDGLSFPWYGKVFINPPYERYVIDEWAAKIHEESTTEGRASLTVSVVPARVNTDWWHVLADDADLVCLLNNRLRFGDAKKTGPYPYAIVVYADDEVPDELIAVLSERGRLNKPQDVPLLRSVGVGTALSIDLDARSMGFPDAVDPEATAFVESAIERDGLVEIMAIRPATDDTPETYYLLNFPKNDPTDIRCAVENVDLKEWRDVPVSVVEPGESASTVDPFTYVA